MSRFIINRSFWMLPLIFWAILVSLSFAWNMADIDSHRQELVTNRARFIFKMVESVRLWNARHGGLYAEVNATTLPNPHLEHDERDIQTPSGRKLTLINPAYMTRQLGDVVDELTGVLVHITSLNPINPDNAASPWESAALQQLEKSRKQSEWSQFSIDNNGKEHFRYIAPLLTKEACLKCHEQQGYQVGDIRGAISITFPPGPLLSPMDDQLRNLSAIHLGVLLLLSLLSLLFLARTRRQFLALESSRSRQEELVEKRTEELRHEARQHQQAEARLRGFIESTGQGIFVVDKQGHFTLCNPAAMKILGYQDVNALLDRNVHEILCRTSDNNQAKEHSHCDGCAILHSYSTGEPHHVELAHFCHADGSAIPVELRSHPLYDKGKIEGAVITFAEISERLEREQQLRKMSMALEYSPVAAMITDHNGYIEYVNHRFVQESGYLAEELLGKTPSLLKSGHTPQSTYEAMWENLTRGEPWQGELLNRKKNGELFWDDTAIAPITDHTGKVINYVAFKENITQRKEEVERVWRQANFDSLTCLPNRNHFLDQLEHHIKEARRYERQFALVFIDLDGFKRVNDSLGHDAGDELLRQSGQRLKESTRSSDVVSRLGGDEFTVIIPEFERYADIELVAQKLIDTLAKPHLLKEQIVRVSATIGISIYPNDAEDSESLINMADTAMYAAKREGKNRYQFYLDGSANHGARSEILGKE